MRPSISLLALVAMLVGCPSAEESEDGCSTDADCPDGARCVAGACAFDEGGGGPRCGDGVVQPERGEGCDLGADNDDAGVCTLTCTPTSCGDGIVQERRGEACDEGAENSDLFARCSAVCREVRCGDGTVDPGEECDEGARNHDGRGACTAICSASRCGDGVLHDDESCDGQPGCTDACRWADPCAVRAVSAGDAITFFLLEDGRLLGAGLNGGWQSLGLPPEIGVVDEPVVLLDGERLDEVHALYAGGVGRTPDGRIVTFGGDQQGERGDGPGWPASIHGTIEAPALVSLQARRSTAMGLDAEGRLWGWGDARSGVLAGAPTTWCPEGPCVQAPTELFPDDATQRFLAVSLGHQHVVALRTDGQLVGWGRNDECQLGCTGEELAARSPYDDGLFTNLAAHVLAEPRRLFPELEGSVLFVAGVATTHVLDRRGLLHALGVNHNVSMGSTHDDRTYHASPNRVAVFVPEGTDDAKLRLLAFGMDAHLLLVDDAGRLYGAGDNGWQQASNTWIYSEIIVQPSPLPAGVRALRAFGGVGTSFVVTPEGALHAIGRNDRGELGVGETSSSSEWRPVPHCPP